jgi:hypothetical protein
MPGSGSAAWAERDIGQQSSITMKSDKSEVREKKFRQRHGFSRRSLLPSPPRQAVQ